MKTIRNMYDKKLTYENLMTAHKKCRKGKSARKDVMLFNLKQEEYILWLYCGNNLLSMLNFYCNLILTKRLFFKI